MDELVKTFHIDWKLLIAQIINFGIVLGVLWYFALKPLMRIMKKRSGEIAKSLKDAKEIEKRLNEAESTKESIVNEARREAQLIMEKSYQGAEKVREQKVIETRKEVEGIMARTKEELAQEKEKMVSAAKQEVASLVVEASSKIIAKNLDNEANRKLIEDTVKEIKK